MISEGFRWRLRNRRGPVVYVGCSFIAISNKILTGYSPGKQEIISHRFGKRLLPESPQLFEAGARGTNINYVPRGLCFKAHRALLHSVIEMSDPIVFFSC